ncbi:MAG: aspartate kinase [Saprospiraceae bacterium]
MSIQVFKFGGASVKNHEGIRNVANIIQTYGVQKPLVIVVSATGKTTNQLEEVIKQKFVQSDQAVQLLKAIQEKHNHIAQELEFEADHCIYQEIHEHIVEAEWVIEEDREMPFDYAYDQIVSVGELISSRLLHRWLEKIGLHAEWLDARELILTNDTYRDARIQWNETNQKIQSRILPLLKTGKIIITQGFIGSTSENNTTTLWREGSDYTAAILSSALQAEAMTIWKDVPGILTADPAKFVNVTKLDRLSYTEAIEMTYYGAKVIHPKTIQPLKLKSIPLYVKSFIAPEGDGSVITGDIDLEYPPIVVLEPNQALVHFSSNDLSFIAEYHLARLFNLFEAHRIKVNMMRNTAISFSVCVTNDPMRISRMIEEVKNEFRVVIDQDLELITVRHYLDHMLPKLTEEKIILLEERIRKTIQMVVKNAPGIAFKPKE